MCVYIYIDTDIFNRFCARTYIYIYIYHIIPYDVILYYVTLHYIILYYII